MAGRFLFRKLSTWMSRSTGLLGAHSPASATASEPVACRARVCREGKHVPGAYHTKVAPSGIHGYLFNGSFSTEATNLPLSAIHAHATRCISPARSIPPAIALKPAFVNSAGVKRAFSSGTSTNGNITHTAEWDTKLAACKADVTDWFAKKKVEDAAFFRYIGVLTGSWCLIFWGCFSVLDSGSSNSGTSKCDGKCGSHCQAAASANLLLKIPKSLIKL